MRTLLLIFGSLLAALFVVVTFKIEQLGWSMALAVLCSTFLIVFLAWVIILVVRWNNSDRLPLLVIGQICIILLIAIIFSLVARNIYGVDARLKNIPGWTNK